MERNISLDYFKIGLSILVITIHAQPIFGSDSILGNIISNGIARAAVPLFFMINGYFFYNKINDFHSVKKYILHIFLIYIVWSLIYLQYYINDSNLLSWIFLGFYHLWYLMGLIMAVLILIISKYIFKNDWILLAVGIALFLTAHIFEFSSSSLFVFRNGIFMGFPFLALGYLIRSQDLTSKLKKYNFQTGVLAIILFIVFAFESYCTIWENKSREFYLSLFVFCPIILIFILNNSKIKKDWSNGYIGNLSSAIYFIHIFVMLIIAGKIGYESLFKFPAIAIVSTLVAILIIFINKRIKIFL